MKQAFLAATYIGAVLAVAAVPISAVADEPAPWPQFTNKFAKPPKAGSIPRITVQVEPTPEPKPAPAEEDGPKSADAGPIAGAFGWYWDAVRPEMTAANTPGRLDTAISQLTQGPGVPTPRLADLQTIAQAHGQEILAATIGTKVSPALVLAVIGIESSGKTGAVSHKGATGLMQLMPDTAARFGTTDLTDPADNIRGGVAYLDWLMGEFGGDPLLVLAGYNAGEGAVMKHGGVPPYDETRAYVPKVLAAWTVARGLCKTPPMLISDGCAFAVAASNQ